MLNDSRTHGLWEDTAPAAPETHPLTGTTRADVVVVGGGYTGLSTALHLAESGADVVLLEAVQIGFGGAGRNVGLVNAGMWVMPDHLIDTLGPDHGNRLLDLLGNAPAEVWARVERHRIDCQPRPVGTLHAATGKAGLAELASRAQQWQDRGAPVELLDRDGAATMLGTDYYASALLDRRAGTVQPLAYARGLARAAIAAGVRIHTGSAVTGIDRDGDWRLRTANGAAIAPKVVFATDAYTRHLMQAISGQQVFLPYFNFATEPLADEIACTILPGRQGAWDTREILTSFRLDAANRLIVGSVGALRNTGAPVHRAWARRTLRRVFPQIGPVRFETEWFGTIGMTDDNLPRFHRLDDGIFAFCGYNGRGIAPGTVFGRVMAEYLLGRLSDAQLPLPVSAPRAIRTAALRSAFYEAGAQVFHLVDARL